MYYIKQSAIDEIDVKDGKGAALELFVSKTQLWLRETCPASSFLRVFGFSNDEFLCELEATIVKDH